MIAHGVPAQSAQKFSHEPPIGILFSAFLGYNPIQHLLGSSVLSHLPPAKAAFLVGRGFFPKLISLPFKDGLHEAFAFAIIACLVGAAASWTRGGRYYYSEAKPLGDQPLDDLEARNLESQGSTRNTEAVPSASAPTASTHRAIPT